MLILGITAMIAVGLTWLTYGVIMGRISKDGISADQLIFFSAALAALISFVIGIARPLPTASWQATALTGAILFVGGLFNNRQLYFLAKAMERGPNGIIWSITQSGFIIPFLVGVICFAVPLTGWRIAGSVALFISVYMMGLTKDNSGTFGKWQLYAFTAFAMTGLSQTLSNLPSYLNSAAAIDSVWRTFFAMAGMAAGTPLAALCSGKWGNFCRETKESLTNKHVWKYTFAVEFFDIAGSIFLLYPGMDILVKANAGAAAYPIMVGSCIAGFEIYSFLWLREKRHAMQWIALLLCLFGVATICC